MSLFVWIGEWTMLLNCRVRHIVLDEADRLLDDGFLDQVDEILAACTAPNLQKSLYSATMPSGIETLANTFMKDPVRVIIGAR
jgi:ATP-dependent RNA helicase DDX52/ROK1